ncbi:MAG: hypothetical protein ACTSYD_02030 [Candidatus Heimdallarchaeaceae archaeon]
MTKRKVEEFKRKLGWQRYIIMVVIYGIVGYLFEKIVPFIKNFIFQLDFQHVLKLVIYYISLGYLISISVPLVALIVFYIYFNLKAWG